MKGYVYATPDGDLGVKTQAYIESEDPAFFGNNRSMVIAYWPFDSNNDEDMKNLLISFRRLRVQPASIYGFYRSISYDTAKLKMDLVDIKGFLPSSHLPRQ